MESITTGSSQIRLPEQQEMIRVGLELYRHGKSYRAIGRHWHEHGHTDRVMHHKTVAAILRRHQPRERQR